MGLWTTAGLNLVATAVQAAPATAAMTYVGISPGCGTLASAITAGVAVTSLAIDAALPANLSSGQSLTVTNGTNSETVTTSSVALAGATSIPILSWTPVHSYTAHATGICPTPLVSDIALYNETIRVAAFAGAAGAGAGESLTSGYFDGSQATKIYLMVGYFGGGTATSSIGTGTLMGEDVQYWNHVINVDSNMYQADSAI